MLKKLIIGFVALLFLILIVLVSIPFFFGDAIKQKADTTVASMFDANIQFSNVNLSLIRNFPYASIKLENFSIVGKNEFRKDTLLFSKDINLIINIKSLFGNNGYDIRKLEFNDAKVFTHVLANGKANWEIWETDSTAVVDTAAMKFHFKLKEFSIHNANIIYKSDISNMVFSLQELNHTTTGDFTADSSQLITKTSCANLSFDWEGMRYISDAKATMDLTIDANLNKMIYKLNDNQSTLNEIPFRLTGWVKSIADGWDMDLALHSGKTNFKALLSMIPAIYSNSFEDIKTAGDFNFGGTIKGSYIGDYYPAFQFKLIASNGWFQYPSLPRKVENIQIEAHVSNPGKTLDATIIDVPNFSFIMAANPFRASMHVENPMTDTYLAMKANGKLNLGLLKEVYPLDKKTSLNGLVDLQLNLAARMSDYEKSQYEKIEFDGWLKMIKFEAKMASLAHKLTIGEAAMQFNNRNILLSRLAMKIGKNDIAANGSLENFIAYALHDKTLKGKLNLSSSYLNINDLMSGTASTKTDTASSSMSTVLIPANIDFDIQAKVAEMQYEKMNFKNLNGGIKIANSELKMYNVAMNGFGGALLMNGLYNTADTLKPKVNFNIAINEVDFKEIFSQVETVQKFVPIFGKAAGKFSTTLQFNSLLKSDMMPDLASVVGGGNFSTNTVGLKNIPALNALASALKKSDIVPMTIKNLALNFDIKDGKLITKPFDFKVSNVNLTVGGSTSLDKSIAYTGKVQLPDKLLAGKLSTLNFAITGTFTKPNISLDLKSVANTLVSDLKDKAKVNIDQQVNDAKQNAIEAARIKRDKAISEANEKAAKLIAEAEKKGNNLIDESKKQGEALISKATNPFTKKAAEIAARKMEETARKQAANIVLKAKEEASKLVEAAENKTNL